MPTLREELDRFCHEALDCYHHFRQSLVIYDQPQDKLDILNGTAQHFFGLLSNMFLDGIVLNLARLTDPPETCGNKNMSLKTIQKDMSQDPKCPTDVYPLLTEIHGIAEESKLWRHKRGAHIGFDEAMGIGTIPPLYLSQVQRFYDLLQEYINWIYMSLFNTIYPIEAVDTKGADELLRAIRYAHALRRYDRTHVLLFDQIIKGKLPSACGTVWSLPFCPDCIPAINGLEITKDPMDSLIKEMACERCARQFCQNQGCKHPFDHGSKLVVIPFMIYRMQRPTLCSACAR